MCHVAETFFPGGKGLHIVDESVSNEYTQFDRVPREAYVSHTDRPGARSRSQAVASSRKSTVYSSTSGGGDPDAASSRPCNSRRSRAQAIASAD